MRPLFAFPWLPRCSIDHFHPSSSMHLDLPRIPFFWISIRRFFLGFYYLGPNMTHIASVFLPHKLHIRIRIFPFPLQAFLDIPFTPIPLRLLNCLPHISSYLHSHRIQASRLINDKLFIFTTKTRTVRCSSRTGLCAPQHVCITQRLSRIMAIFSTPATSESCRNFFSKYSFYHLRHKSSGIILFQFGSKLQNLR